MISGIQAGTLPTDAIQIRLEKVSQLFSTLDPYPFRQRDLDKDAEEFIVDWARELPEDQPIHIIIYLPSAEAIVAESDGLSAALKSYFEYREEIVRLDLNELFRVGRRSLVIGLSVLAGCLTLGHIVSGLLKTSEIGRFFQEGLIILGWVANWKPIEIFLYDWWPIAKRRTLYKRLSQANVDLRTDGARSP